METITISKNLAEEIIEQLKGAQADHYVQDTQDIIDDLNKTFKESDLIANVMHCLLPELNKINSGDEHKDWYTATLQHWLREAKSKDGNLVVAICNALEDYLK